MSQTQNSSNGRSGDRPWWQSYPPNLPRELPGEIPETLVALFEQACVEFKDLPAFDCLGHQLSYGVTYNLARNCAAWLQQQAKVSKGQRVALMCPNSLPFPVAMMGNLMCGAAQVNINPRYTSRELKHQLNDAKVELIFIAESALQTLLQVIEETPVRRVIVIGETDLQGNNTGISNPLPVSQGTEFYAFSEILSQGGELSFNDVEINGDDCAFLQYTGGTTGLAKGARLSHRNITSSIECKLLVTQDVLQKGEETALTVLPLYHIFGLQVNCFTFLRLGGLIRLVGNASNPDLLIDELTRTPPVTFITGVNSLFNAIMDSPRAKEVDFSHIKISLGGGTSIMPVVSQRWKELTGKNIKEGYGMSETAGGATMMPLHIDEFNGSVGLPYPSIDISLRDDQGQPVPVGSPGEICVKGPNVMSGYIGGEDLNEDAFTNDGYFLTGDIGIFDDDGFLRIVDRKKDVVLVSGFNVYPIEVDNVVAEVPGVKECACIGVPDDKSGERIMAFIVAQAGATIDGVTVNDHCKEHLTAYKRPREIRFVESLPRSAVGKILRKELRETYIRPNESGQVA